MRKGYNPYKDSPLENTDYTHQVVVPVYIPHLKSYFHDALRILELCLKSLIRTTHKRTFITVVNNGSCTEVISFLDRFYKEKHIQEVIHTANIGKINAVLKGASGHSMPLVTVTDADVLFLKHWQEQTLNVFNHYNRTGVVGLIPQFLSYQYNCENLLFNNFFNNKIRFAKIKNPDALVKFYKSVGWDDNYPKQRLEYTLCLHHAKEFKAYLGSGHVVSTFKRKILNNARINSKFKMGGDSEASLDALPSKLGYASLTTFDNFAYHMGNIWEPWMEENFEVSKFNNKEIKLQPFSSPRKPFTWEWKIKRKLISYIFKRFKLRMLFLSFKGLPRNIRENF